MASRFEAVPMSRAALERLPGQLVVEQLKEWSIQVYQGQIGSATVVIVKMSKAVPVQDPV